MTRLVLLPGMLQLYNNLIRCAVTARKDIIQPHLFEKKCGMRVGSHVAE